MSFKNWLLGYRRKSIIQHLAEYCRNDETLADVDWDETFLRGYMEHCGACGEALDALRRAVIAYRKYERKSA